MLPVLELSPCGHDVEPQRALLDVAGTVYSYTRLEKGDGPEGFIAMADFFDGRLRVNAPVLAVASVAIGDTVRVVAATDTPYALQVTS